MEPPQASLMGLPWELLQYVLARVDPNDTQSVLAICSANSVVRTACEEPAINWRRDYPQIGAVLPQQLREETLMSLLDVTAYLPPARALARKCVIGALLRIATHNGDESPRVRDALGVDLRLPLADHESAVAALPAFVGFPSDHVPLAQATIVDLFGPGTAVVTNPPRLFYVARADISRIARLLQHPEFAPYVKHRINEALRLFGPLACDNVDLWFAYPDARVYLVDAGAAPALAVSLPIRDTRVL